MGTDAVRINIGCGDKLLDGYINIDVAEARAGKTPDVLSDVRDLPFDENYADEALAVHVIEHFYRWEVPKVLAEWRRILKPGGVMVLECPDLMKAVFHLLSSPAKEQLSMWPLYGDPSWKDPLMCHKWAYTPQTLGQAMHEAGFVNLRQEPAQFKLKDLRDMRIVGEKPQAA